VSARDWDAASYDRVSAPQLQWAREQLERLALRGDEVVLDAGCGTGRVTALLCERVPRGRVYGVDAAPSMAAFSRRALGARAQILQQDLVALELPEPVDVVFSNATFHWIADHDALFAALARNMKAGGRLVAQCGGRGNIARFLAVAAAVAAQAPFELDLRDFSDPHNFAGPEETEARLRRAGFEQVRCWLAERPATPPEPAEFARTVCLAPILEALPEPLREPFVGRVLQRVGEPLVLDYVRLNITATRPQPAATCKT
jgi:trans-aconitate 2-methyltransferase